MNLSLGGYRIPGIDEGFKSSTGADLGRGCGQIVANAARFAALRARLRDRREKRRL